MNRKLVLQSLKKTLLILPYIAILSLSDIILSTPQEQLLSTALWYGIFDRVTGRNIHMLIMSMESLGYIFLFSLLFGTYLSGFFDSISTFFFTRLSNRCIWVVKKILCLCGISAFYTVLLLGLKFLISIRQVTVWNMDFSIVFMLFMLFFTLSVLFVTICLLINWISIRHGVPIGILFVFVLVLVLELTAIFFFDSPINMICNPLCFNIEILSSVPLTLAKILVGIFYLVLVSAGMAAYIGRMDIFK